MDFLSRQSPPLDLGGVREIGPYNVSRSVHISAVEDVDKVLGDLVPSY